MPTGPDTVTGTVTRAYRSNESRYAGRIDCDGIDRELSFACFEWEVGEDRFEELVDFVGSGERYRFDAVEDATANSLPEDTKIGEEATVCRAASAGGGAETATD